MSCNCKFPVALPRGVVPRAGLQFMVVVFTDNTHLLFGV